MRSRIVMRAQQDSFFAFRMPLDNDIRHRHGITAERVVCPEALQRYLAAGLLEKLFQKSLLLFHSRRSTRPRPYCAELLQVPVGALPIERIHWLNHDIRRLWFGSVGRWCRVLSDNVACRRA